MTSRWTNPHQPQTLQISVLLLYFRAVFAVLTGFAGVGILLAVAMGAGAFGIANEKKWGYILAVAASVLPVLWDIRVLLASNLTVGLISLLFDGALLALLLHPMSRDYQRIWFK